MFMMSPINRIFLGYRSNIFTPASLFGDGQPGHWSGGYDPAGVRLWQDAAGTIPAILPDQPVGLVLDYSLEALRGPELIANGDFSGGAAGWNLSAGMAITGGKLVFTGAGSGTQAWQPYTASGTFEVTIVVDSISAGTVQPWLHGVSAPVANIDAPGTHVQRITGGGASRLAIRSVGTTTAVISSVSFRQIAGNHAFQATALSRPTLAKAGGIWHLSNDGGDSLPVTLPAGLYGRAWVDANRLFAVDTVTDPTNALIPTAVNTTQADVILRQGAFTDAEKAQIRSYWESIYGPLVTAPWELLSGLLSPGSTSLDIWWPHQTFWFSDAAGLVPWVSGPVRGWRSTRGTLLAQPTNADYAPTAGVFSNGNAALSYDGVDDRLQSASAYDLSASDSLTLFASARRDAAPSGSQSLCETGVNTASQGGFYLINELAVGNRMNYAGRGGRAGNSADFTTAPNLGTGAVDMVLTAQQALNSGLPSTLRMNGALRGTSTNTDFGGGNFASDLRLNVGARNAGASIFWKGLIGPLVIRGGPLLPEATIAAAEVIINQHVGAY